MSVEATLPLYVASATTPSNCFISPIVSIHCLDRFGASGLVFLMISHHRCAHSGSSRCYMQTTLQWYNSWRKNFPTAEQHCRVTGTLSSIYLLLFQGQCLWAKKGAAMGSPVSEVVANLYMGHFKQLALKSVPLWPRLWKRYDDHMCCMFNSGAMEEFHYHIHGIQMTVQFTPELENGGVLPFLNTC